VTAGEYLQDYARDLKRWSHMSAALQIGLVNELTPQPWLFAGPEQWTRDERIGWLTEQVYPRLAEAREIHMNHLGGKK